MPSSRGSVGSLFWKPASGIRHLASGRWAEGRDIRFSGAERVHLTGPIAGPPQPGVNAGLFVAIPPGPHLGCGRMNPDGGAGNTGGGLSRRPR